MLPVWLSDLRGFLLAFVCSCLACARGVRCQLLAATLGAICALGFAFSVAFYVHTTRTVFNRRPTWSLRCYWKHLMVTRPLEALWRFLTAPLRATPDFHILGEVRTGTTSLAAYLRDSGCIGPFSPWIVPLASDKESFYFAGHYFGFVHPAAYRMCFPLRPVLWFRRRVLGRPSPVFDACASHLSTPWTARFLRIATPDAALVVLLRAPAEQHESWWRLEMGTHAWARSMGMGESFLPAEYPPKSFKEAIALSRTPRVAALYKEAELAGVRFQAARGCCARLRAAWLPERWLPFPGGQLAAFAHMGRYFDNIERFAMLFGGSRLVLAGSEGLAELGGAAHVLNSLAALVPSVDRLVRGRGAKEAAHPPAVQRLNTAGALPPGLEARPEDLAELRAYYREDNQRLFQMIQRDLGWNDPPARR